MLVSTHHAFPHPCTLRVGEVLSGISALTFLSFYLLRAHSEKNTLCLGNICYSNTFSSFNFLFLWFSKAYSTLHLVNNSLRLLKFVYIHIKTYTVRSRISVTHTKKGIC